VQHWPPAAGSKLGPTAVSEPPNEALSRALARGVTTYRTRTGRILTEVDLDRLSEEAERNYDLTQPCGWLNYRGDQRGALGQRMGPSLTGELFTVIAAAYDRATNRTRLGLEVTGHILDSVTEAGD
jgi:hypothetical protein